MIPGRDPASGDADSRSLKWHLNVVARRAIHDLPGHGSRNIPVEVAEQGRSLVCGCMENGEKFLNVHSSRK